MMIIFPGVDPRRQNWIIWFPLLELEETGIAWDRYCWRIRRSGDWQIRRNFLYAWVFPFEGAYLWISLKKLPLSFSLGTNFPREKFLPLKSDISGLENLNKAIFSAIVRYKRALVLILNVLCFRKTAISLHLPSFFLFPAWERQPAMGAGRGVFREFPFFFSGSKN